MTQLSGCGDGADDGGTTRPPVDYSTYAVMDRQLHGTWDSAGFTDPATLPGSGGATYDGVLILDAQIGSGQIDLAGAVQLGVDFGSSSISGQANGFRDASEQNYLGVLSISNGSIDRSADPNISASVFMDIDGTLSGGGQNLGLSGDMSGDFLGSTAGAIVGVLSGVVTSSSGPGALFGDFIAQD